MAEMTSGSLFFIVDLRENACYQYCSISHFSGFKLGTSMCVLSVLDVY